MYTYIKKQKRLYSDFPAEKHFSNLSLIQNYIQKSTK